MHRLSLLLRVSRRFFRIHRVLSLCHLAPSSPRHFGSYSLCLGRSSLVLVACRWVIRHHLRGRVEKASFIVPVACFSSVLSYSSRTLPMSSSALLPSSSLIVFPVSRVFLCDFCGASLGDSPSSAAAARSWVKSTVCRVCCVFLVILSRLSCAVPPSAVECGVRLFSSSSLVRLSLRSAR